MLEGKRVIAPERDLREVQNAIACYGMMDKWNPGSPRHLLAAHKHLMAGLVPKPGSWRSRAVGIARGNTISHVAPPAGRVPGLMANLLEWVKKEKVVPAPIKAAVFHYELEFIHPFDDGNGRIGRLWHSLILSRYHPVFAHVPVESAIRDHQAEYYRVLGDCDLAGKSTAFIEFALQLTLEALQASLAQPLSRMDGKQRIQAARERFNKVSFSRKDYLACFPALSPASASRDLQQATQEGVLIKAGDKALTSYRFA